MVEWLVRFLPMWIIVGNARRKAQRRLKTFLYGIPVWRRARRDKEHYDAHFTAGRFH